VSAEQEPQHRPVVLSPKKPPKEPDGHVLSRALAKVPAARGLGAVIYELAVMSA
jgi:hypothetical protein